MGGMYFTQDEVTVAEGRMADPRRADEMVATAQAARIAHWHLGETVAFGAYTLQQANSPTFDLTTAKPAVRFSATLVGLVVLPSQVVHDDVDAFPTDVIMTPALTRRLSDSWAYPTYALRLDQGSRAVSAMERAIIGVLPPGSPYTFHVTSVVEGQVERASKPEAIALGTFGAIAALAALLIAGLAISRGLWENDGDLDVLRALGADPVTRTLDASLGTVVAVVIGSLLAFVVAVALSPLGAARPHTPGGPGATGRRRLDRARDRGRRPGGGPGGLHCGARLPPGRPSVGRAGRAGRTAIVRRQRRGPDGAAGTGGRRAAVLARTWPRSHRGPGALGTHRRGTGRHRGGGDGYVRQQPPHPRLAPGAVRVELELRNRLARRQQHPPRRRCAHGPRPRRRLVDRLQLRQRPDRRPDRPRPDHGQAQPARARRSCLGTRYGPSTRSSLVPPPWRLCTRNSGTP